MRVPTIECRQLSPVFVKELGAFFKAIHEAGFERWFHPHPFTEDEAQHRAAHSGKDIYYVLVENERIVGYGMLRGWDEGFDVPSLGIVLHPELVGMGAGRMLMELLHVAARRRGAKCVRLKVYPDNVAALTLYQSMGYVFHGPEGDQLVGLRTL